jgi:acetate kinase
LLSDVTELAAFGHRVVHGGPSFNHPMIVDDAVVAEIEIVVIY